uniref:Ankyrin repeat and SOCS box protein 13 isoform X2 n=1 Tax=Nicotiana tabacum TaxID=4097 RepID=A0A1S4BP50_TOBAC|nr:PREDICTED: ankyrin repeat and SOCS box protein 13-like isoform X2 [Nicotiana tabacum]
MLSESLRSLRQGWFTMLSESLRSLRQDNFNGNIDEPLEDGDTALHLTCLYGHLACVELLLERGASVEAKDEDGALPLHDACAGGYTEIVRLLINGAPDPECVKRMMESFDEEGDAPLHHAARGEHVDVIKLLLASGASAMTRNLYGRMPSELVEPESEVCRILQEAINAELGR